MVFKRNRNRKLRHRFGDSVTASPSNYQQQVNDLTGAMGPASGNLANWKNTMTTTGDPWNLGASPIYFSPSVGRYITSFESNAAPMSIAFQGLPDSNGVIGSWNPSSGFGRRHRKRQRSKSRFGSKCGPCGSRFGSAKCGPCGSRYGLRKLKRSRK